jgi:hypothetical protein
MGTPLSSSNKTYLPDIAEIMVKVQLNTIVIDLLNIREIYKTNWFYFMEYLFTKRTTKM